MGYEGVAVASRNRIVPKWLSAFNFQVHFGRSKRYWCVLSGSTLLFYKRPSQQIPQTQLCLQHAQVKETPRSSEDESDTEDSFQTNRQYSLELVTVDGNNTYLLLPSAEEKVSFYICINAKIVRLFVVILQERWMYHLSIGASGGAHISGTPFELLIHKLMEVDGNAGSYPDVYAHESFETVRFCFFR